MSGIKGNTVAAVRDGANEEFDKVKAELEAKRKELDEIKAAFEAKSRESDANAAVIAALKEEVDAKTEEDNRQAAEIASLKKTVAVLEKSVAAAKSEVNVEDSIADELIEVVALPFSPEVKVGQLVYNGKTARREKDEDGFYHFWVERARAEALLANTGGMKFVLAGPGNTLKFKRMSGVHAVEVTVFKHVKTKLSSGAVIWQPVIEEESKD